MECCFFSLGLNYLAPVTFFGECFTPLIISFFPWFAFQNYQKLLLSNKEDQKALDNLIALLEEGRLEILIGLIERSLDSTQDAVKE